MRKFDLVFENDKAYLHMEDSITDQKFVVSCKDLKQPELIFTYDKAAGYSYEMAGKIIDNTDWLREDDLDRIAAAFFRDFYSYFVKEDD